MLHFSLPGPTTRKGIYFAPPPKIYLLQHNIDILLESGDNSKMLYIADKIYDSDIEQ